MAARYQKRISAPRPCSCNVCLFVMWHWRPPQDQDPLVPCSQTIEYLKLIARAALQQRSGTISNILTEVRDHSDWTKPLQCSMSGNLKGHEVISSAPFNGNNGQYVGSQGAFQCSMIGSSEWIGHTGFKSSWVCHLSRNQRPPTRW